MTHDKQSGAELKACPNDAVLDEMVKHLKALGLDEQVSAVEELREEYAGLCHDFDRLKARETDLTNTRSLPQAGEGVVEQFARAMFDEGPPHAISEALAEQSGQPIGTPLTWEMVLGMGGNHNGLLKLARGAARLHSSLLAALPPAGRVEELEALKHDLRRSMETANEHLNAAEKMREALESLIAVTEETTTCRADDPQSDPFCPVCRALHAARTALTGKVHP